MSPRLAVLAVLSVACGDRTQVAEEPALGDVRVLALFSGDASAVVALPAGAPFNAPLEADDGELWLFPYSAAALAARYPSLAGASPEQLAARLAPRLVRADEGAAPPPEPLAVLRLSLPAATDPAPYVASTWRDWQAASATPPRSPFTTALDPAEAACGRIRVEVWDGPADVGLEAVAMLSADRAVAAGSRADDAPTVWLSLGADGPAPMAGPAGMVGRVTALASAGDGVVYGLGDAARPSGGRVFALDARGDERAAPTLTGAGGLLSAAEDGSVLVSFDGGAFAWTRGATVAAARPDVIEVPRRLHLASRQRAAVVDVRGLVVWDGARWSLEHAFGPNEFPQALGGDESTLILSGESGLVLVRDAATHTWTKLPVPPARPRLLLASAALGGGRFLVVGHPGYAVVWMGSTWCLLDTGSTVIFTAATRIGAQSAAWAVSLENPAMSGDGPRILRVSLED